MAKEYRKELRALETQIRKAKRDQGAHLAACTRTNEKILAAAERATKKLDRAATRDVCANNRDFSRLDKGTRKQLAKFEKRKAILIGRLS